MFLEFYHLRQQPFGVTPDPAYLYLSPTHREALDCLLSGIQEGRGFFALIAEPGMGKTTLLYQLLDELHDSARTVFLFQTQCNSREFFQYLLNELGVDTKEMDLVSMHGKLNEILFAEMVAGRRFVLIVDEAQNLEDSVLETVRLLSNFETSYAKMLQIVLAGQPQLSDKLAQPQLAQLRQRLAVRARLDALSPAETTNYVEHRLKVAGYSGAPLFSPEAMALIAKHSRGVPRTINHLCYGALSAAHSKGMETVSPEIVRETASKLGFEDDPEEPVANIAVTTEPRVEPSVMPEVVPEVVPSVESNAMSGILPDIAPDVAPVTVPDIAQPDAAAKEAVTTAQAEVPAEAALQTSTPDIALWASTPDVPLQNSPADLALQSSASDDAVQDSISDIATQPPPSEIPLKPFSEDVSPQSALAVSVQRSGFTLTYAPEKRFRFPRWASRSLVVAAILVLGGFTLTAFMLRLGVPEQEKTPKGSPTPQPPSTVGAPSSGHAPAQATLPAPQVQTRNSADYTANPQDLAAGQVITVAAMPGQTVEDLSRIYVGRYDPELLVKIHQLNPELKKPIQLQPGQLIRLPIPAGSFRKGKSFTPDE